MKSRVIFISFVIFLFLQGLCSASEYFPLEVGNSWVFKKIGSLYGYETVNIDEMIAVDEKEYFHMENRYYRKDNTGKVYVSSGDSLDTDSELEMVMYDFGANVDDSWELFLWAVDYTVTLESTAETVETDAGTFYNCYKFSFKAPENVDDADFTKWFAPGIGEVQSTSSFTHNILSEVTVTCSVAEYFPLEVGNSWEYKIYGYNFGDNLVNIDQMVVVDEKEYFHMDKHYYRMDITGKVYISSGDSLDTNPELEAVMYDFSAEAGDSWETVLHGMEYTVTLESVSDTVETLAGTFQNCYKFSFMAPEYVTDSDFIEWFAPGIGRVKVIQSFLGKFLSHATVNGVEIESYVEEEKNAPVPFEIVNYPNPFNPTTTISYSLPQNAHTCIEVFSSTGNKISTLINEPMSAGEHSVNFNGEGLPSGLYFYRIKTGNIGKTGRMLLIK